VLLIEEARLQHAGGENEKAVILAQQAVTMEDSTDNRRFLEDLLSEKKRGWTAGTLYQVDNQNRKNFIFEQSLDVARTGPLRWDVMQHYGRFQETGAASVTDNGGGASMLWSLRKHHLLQIRSDWHHYAQALKDDYSVEGRWEAPWSAQWNSQLEAARMPYDTARAIDAVVKDRLARASLHWKDPDTWQVGILGAGHALSDDNKRYTGSVEVSRNIEWKFLTGIIRSTFDQMDKISPNYYCPQHLETYQFGLDLTQWWSQKSHMRIRYLPGIGKEDATAWDFTQEASASFSVPAGRLSIEPSYVYYMTPTYRAHSYFLNLALPF